MTEIEKERDEKIANMQRLIDEGRSSGISDESMEDIRARALRQVELSHSQNPILARNKRE